jgi:hypothetical protein
MSELKAQMEGVKKLQAEGEKRKLELIPVQNNGSEPGT